MHVLITRPHDDGVALQAKLRALDILSTLAPTQALQFEKLSSLDLDNVQACVVTSRNGLKSVAHNALVERLSSKALYTVGSATADYAKTLGLTSVRIGPGTAKGLAEQIIKECDPKKGSILYIAGAHLAFDLKTALEVAGFTVREETAYRAEPVSCFPEPAIHALRDNKINAVILMSARSAASFAALVKHHNLTKATSRLHYFCLSSSVKDSLVSALPDVRQDCLLVAHRPNTEELLALITRFAANYRQIS